MLPISTKQLHRFTPPEVAWEESPPVYLIAVPTVWVRAEFQQRMTAAGAINPTDDEFRDSLVAGIRSLYPANDADELAALVRAAAFEAQDEGGQTKIVAAERAVRAGYQPYRDLLAERTRFMELRPLIACKMLLKGVERVEVEFRTEFSEVHDDTMAALDPAHVVQVGLKAIDLMYVPRGLEKNFESPPPSPPGRKTSEAAGNRPTRSSSGGSGKKSTKKTPASC